MKFSPTVLVENSSAKSTSRTATSRHGCIWMISIKLQSPLLVVYTNGQSCQWDCIMPPPSNNDDWSQHFVTFSVTSAIASWMISLVGLVLLQIISKMFTRSSWPCIRQVSLLTLRKQPYSQPKLNFWDTISLTTTSKPVRRRPVVSLIGLFRLSQQRPANSWGLSATSRISCPNCLFTVAF